MKWWEGRMAALDIESTSVDVEEARVVTVTIAAIGGGVAAEVVTLIADPGIPIPEGAAAIHGYTTERARAEGKPARDVIVGALSLLRSLAHLPLCTYNGRYDLTVMDREARRHGLEPFVPAVVLDGLVLDKHLDPYRKGSRRLEAVCGHYDCRLDGAHDSAHDAFAAARVVYRIGQRTELGHMTAEGLHAAQIGWAAEQARSLREYFERTGKDASDIRKDWPIVPLT